MSALALYVAGKIIIGPEQFECARGSNKGMVVATECAVVFAGLPVVVLWLDERERERQAVA